MTDNTMSQAEILNATQQFSNFLMKLQRFPELMTNAVSLLGATEELQKRLATLREEEQIAAARLYAANKSVETAQEQAQNAYASAINEQKRQVNVLQASVEELSLTQDRLRAEIVDLQSHKSALSQSLEAVKVALR